MPLEAPLPIIANKQASGRRMQTQSHILVVDDDVGIRSLICELLEEMG